MEPSRAQLADSPVMQAYVRTPQDAALHLRELLGEHLLLGLFNQRRVCIKDGEYYIQQTGSALVQGDRDSVCPYIVLGPAGCA